MRLQKRKFIYSHETPLDPVPKLEFASEIWSPYTCKDKLLLESVKCRATKFILNYPKDISYKERLLKLDLLPLENRRDLKDLVLIFKAKEKHVDLGHQHFSRKRKYTVARAMHANLTKIYLMQTKTILNTHFSIDR